MSFGKLQSQGQNFVSRLGGAQILSPEQQAQLTPEQLQAYNQQREMARSAGMRELSARLSDAFAGRDVAARAIERAEARRPQTSSFTAGRRDYEYFQSLTPEQQREFLLATGRTSPELAAEFRKAKAPGGLDLTPGQKKTDEAFSKIFTDWGFGEKQQAEANIRNLDNKLALLATGRENVSGKDIALTPDKLKPILHPQATGFLDEVSDIVFQSLKATLGAQFTEQEGKRLVAATFNQALPEELNLPRLQRLLAKIKSVYQSKQDAIDYYNQNNTLAGFTQETSSFDDILDAVYFDELNLLSKEQILDRYKNARTPEERQTILRYAEKLDKQSGQ